MFWNCSILGVTDSGSLIHIEIKQPANWISLSFKFTFTNNNVEYIEREDEFDKIAEEKIIATNFISKDTDSIDKSHYYHYYIAKNTYTKQLQKPFYYALHKLFNPKIKGDDTSLNLDIESEIRYISENKQTMEIETKIENITM